MTDEQRDIKLFTLDFTIDGSGKQTAKELKFDAFLKKGKVRYIHVEIFQTAPHPTLPTPAKAQKAILATDNNREMIKLRMAAKGNSVEIFGNAAEATKNINVFSLNKIFEKQEFQGWTYPKDTVLDFIVSHILPENVTTQFGFPLIGTISAEVEYLPEEQQ